MRTYKGPMAILVKITAIVAMVFSVLYVFDVFDVLYAFNLFLSSSGFRALWSALVLALVFLLVPATKKAPHDRLPWYDAVLAVATFPAAVYIIANYASIAVHGIYATNAEIVLGIIAILVSLEAVRRTLSWVIVVLAVVAILYALFCNYFPGLLHGKGFSLPMVVAYLFLYDDGMFGAIIKIISGLVVAYVLFGQFLLGGGAGKFLTDIAFGLTGGFRGGPAKAAIVASGAMGTISGSAVGILVTTGSITIPMMKSVGYKPYFAGAVESVASVGGAIMPPVMGAVAFIMADFLGVTYNTIAIAAFWPAILYYIALFLQVHFEAARAGLRGLPREELPSVKKTLAQGWPFFIPIVILVYFLLIVRYEATMAAYYGTGAMIVASMLRKETRFSPTKGLQALEESGRLMRLIVPVCLVAGLIVASLSLTGLGIRTSQLLIAISGGNMAILLVLAFVASIVMGMGLPWVACYIILATLIAPSLVTMGVPPIAAHLFILYMGVLSFLTPPVCAAIFVACGIAGSNMWQTGWTAMRLGIVAYLVPFMFVFRPTLLLIGTLPDIVMATVTSLIGVFSLASGVSGYLTTKLNWLLRTILIGAGILLMIPDVMLSVIGGVALALVLLAQFITRRRLRLMEPSLVSGVLTGQEKDAKEDSNYSRQDES